MRISVIAEGAVFSRIRCEQLSRPRTGPSTPWDLPFTGLHVPVAVAVAVRGVGDRYVADVLDNRVVVLPHFWTTPTVVPCPVVFGPYAMAANDRGDVFVTTANNTVSVLSAAMNSVAVLPFDDVD